MAYYVSNWQDIKIRVHIIADEGTEVSTLPTHFCPGSIATVIGDKEYVLSASYEWIASPQ